MGACVCTRGTGDCLHCHLHFSLTHAASVFKRPCPEIPATSAELGDFWVQSTSSGWFSSTKRVLPAPPCQAPPMLIYFLCSSDKPQKTGFLRKYSGSPCPASGQGLPTTLSTQLLAKATRHQGALAPRGLHPGAHPWSTRPHGLGLRAAGRSLRAALSWPRWLPPSWRGLPTPGRAAFPPAWQFAQPNKSASDEVSAVWVPRGL